MSPNYISQAEDSLLNARYAVIFAAMHTDESASEDIGRLAEEIWNIEQRLSEVLVAGETR